MESQKFMEHALLLARQNVIEKGGRPFGAVIVQNGDIVATGVNDVLETHDPTGHAEMKAIQEASKKLGSELLSDCEIYASGQPCPMCETAIRLADIKAVYYASTREEAAKANVSLPGKNKDVPFQYVKVEGSSDPLDLWVKRGGSFEK